MLAPLAPPPLTLVRRYYYETSLFSIYGICIVIGFLAWGVAESITEVFECGTRTVLLCYFADVEANGTGGSHCPRELRIFYEQAGGDHTDGGDSDVASSEEDKVEVEKGRRGMRGTRVITH